MNWEIELKKLSRMQLKRQKWKIQNGSVSRILEREKEIIKEIVAEHCAE